MATKIYKFAGTCKWAKVHRMDEEYQNYTINVYLDDESMALYESSGCQMKVKEDDDGKYVTFRRPHQKLIGQDLKEFGKPRVVDAEGEPLSRNIGNGSDVVVKVEVFEGKKGTGHRLEAVLVRNLIPYDEKEEVSAEGLADLPDF